MQTFEIRIKIAGGNKTFRIEAADIIEATHEMERKVSEGLTALAKANLDEIEIKKLA